MSYQVEVKAVGSPIWTPNRVYLASRSEARSYGNDLASRWSGVEQWRVIESNEPVNYQFREGGLVHVES